MVNFVIVASAFIQTITSQVGHSRRSGKFRSNRNRVTHRIKCVFHPIARVCLCDGDRSHLVNVAGVRGCERGNSVRAGSGRHADVITRGRPCVTHAFRGAKVDGIRCTATTH